MQFPLNGKSVNKKDLRGLHQKKEKTQRNFLKSKFSSSMGSDTGGSHIEKYIFRIDKCYQLEPLRRHNQ